VTKRHASIVVAFAFPIPTADLLKLRDVTARDRAKAKEESGKLMTALQLSCDLTGCCVT
jgi:hypothetical protein